MNAIETTVACDLDEADRRVRAALATQGFGVLTEIDVAATLKAKLGVDRPALRILGACNPSFAHRSLELDESVALLLPCNVVLDDVGGRTRVRAVDPTALMEGDDFAELTAEVQARLQAAIDEVAAGA
jgi:uncharacterized protein (DUF302 family)